MSVLVTVLGVFGAVLAAVKFQYGGLCFWIAVGLPVLAIIYGLISAGTIDSRDSDIQGGLITDDLNRIHAALARHEEEKRSSQRAVAVMCCLLATSYIIATVLGYCWQSDS